VVGYINQTSTNIPISQSKYPNIYKYSEANILIILIAEKKSRNLRLEKSKFLKIIQ